jgi:preprotein translocase subunit SecF
MKIDKITVGISLVCTLLAAAVISTWNVGTAVSGMDARVNNLTLHAETMENGSRKTITELQGIRVTMERIDARESGTTNLLQMEINSLEKQMTELRQLVRDLLKRDKQK